MTLQLRKKRRITRLSFRVRSEARGARREARGLEFRRGSRIEGRGPDGRQLRAGGRRLVAGACVAAVFGALVICVAGQGASASELVWRNSGAGDSSASSQASPSSSPVRTQAGTPASRGSALRFVRPANVHVDNSVRMAAFDDAPQLSSGRSSDNNTRSVVVNRDDAADGFRAAQLPQNSGNNNSTSQPNSANASPLSNDRLRSPFGEQPSPPPPLETPPTPENITVPPPKKNTAPVEQPQPVTPVPVAPAPAQTPEVEQPTAAPPTGQFQPVLPSGPTVGPTGGPEPSPSATSNATIKEEGVQAEESCEKSLKNLKAYTVDKVKLDISISGTAGKDYPFECSIDDGDQFKGRCWDQTTYMWKASALCHKPLYFEDEQLERYGHSYSPCFQPFISGAHFFCTLPVLPYCMGVEPPCECIYALGYYRPGSCAPYMINPVPLSPRGALFEAGAVTGAAFALP